MNPQPTRGLSKQRLIGIDLFRGTAAFAVAIIHADAVMFYSGFPTDKLMTAITQLSRFAVPFFLAASFYLMTSKLYTSESHFSITSNLKSKFTRLLVPYLCWSVIYIGLRVILALSTSQGWEKIFQDPVRLIFLGGASFHLYFLPLLFAGSFLIIVAEYLAKKPIKIKTLVFLFVFSIILYELLKVSGNNFQLGTYCFENGTSCSVSFQNIIKWVLPNGNNNQLLRLVLVEISWLIQCLPYVFMGMLLHYPLIKINISKNNPINTILFLVIVLILSALGIINVFNILYFPQALYEVGIACIMLIWAISLSATLKENRLVENLGVCSFGIYLIHYLALIVYAKLAARLPTEFIGLIPALSMLTLASLSFITSWIITSLLLRKKRISKLLFGI
ncbi:hypothetical protein Cylst_0431 [Cylindrospermum stagnale PCC 7417]|uniref:Acyltransferase 3 domain-containing protein n=1 Tax=Cylindrospermum stagnale PCC 7417 TaxID=56107 RepID=K9WRF2_9NOST|nr:acyltransferase [Cylindrospermum stagnale]AFZ22778.1 hypothetical protein Cylst_0431 [Cylindrospermum stagnale PCC 7417]